MCEKASAAEDDYAHDSHTAWYSPTCCNVCRARVTTYLGGRGKQRSFLLAPLYFHALCSPLPSLLGPLPLPLPLPLRLDAIALRARGKQASGRV
jgi:hypothetical protein